MKSTILCALPLALGLACSQGGSTAGPAAGPPAAAVDQPYTDTQAYSADKAASLPSATEGAAVTHHAVQGAGRTLAFTAKAGHLTITQAQTGAPRASIFYMAYTLDGQDSGSRPVTFFYNGGPGSSSVLLHLGSFGPRRMVTGVPAMTERVFPLVDNQESILDLTDMVFIDPVGTGYSEAIAPSVNRDFWGVDVDAESLRDFIVRYLKVHQREASPKFLFGESYGTPRSAVLSHKLETAGVHLAGVVLQSSILNYYSNAYFVTDPLFNNSALFPTYAASGAYFRRTHPVPTDIPAMLRTMRTFTADVYGPAVDGVLARKALLPSDTALVPRLVDATGIPADIWSSTTKLDVAWESENFNLYPYYFQLDLIPGSYLGIYDARMPSPATSEDDASFSFVSGPFASAMQQHLAAYLQYRCASTYVTLSQANEYWDYRHDGLEAPDTVPDLAAAFTQNPSLRVFAASGCYDLICPFHQTELDLARIASLPIHPRISLRTYLGGHMTYLDDLARVQERADLTAFYQGTLPTDTLPRISTLPAARATLAQPPRSLRTPRKGQDLLLMPRPMPLPRRLPTSGPALQEQVDRKLKAASEP